MTLRLGSLFSGYGGLDRAVGNVFSSDTVWHAEFEEAPSKVLSTRSPGVPNLGDVTKIDWETVPDIDILAGGTPCQDLSTAGRRAGMREGTRSNLWVEMREAIEVKEPQYVIWENVQGAYSAKAFSEMEQCPGCVGDGSSDYLRALGRVLGDLADLGYDARWHGLRAADVGAPHNRFRVFVIGYPAGTGLQRGSRREIQRHEFGTRHRATTDPTVRGGDGEHITTARCGHVETGRCGCGESSGTRDWGQYTEAIRRWENVLNRPAPAPTQLNRNGNPQLSARFIEWMMGLPDSHVTGVEGLTRAQQIKMLGNGVVPQQATEALERMLT